MWAAGAVFDLRKQHLPVFQRGACSVKRNLIRGLELILAAVLAVSLVMIFRTQTEYAQGESSYEEAAATAGLPKLTAIPVQVKQESGRPEAGTAVSDPNLALLAEMDLDGLRRKNPDVLGWISIPETPLSYPLLQGEDNDFYLEHTWQKSSGIVGAVFMDCRSSAELTDFNTIIYGHRMRDGSMFASLKYYQDQDHWRTHPSVYLAGAGGVYRYDIFSAYEADVLGLVYDVNARGADERQAFIDSCLDLSVIETNIAPMADDQLLTLSTCTGRGYRTRWVVQAVLAESYAGHEDVPGAELPNDM